MAYRATTPDVPNDFYTVPSEIISLIASMLTVDIHAPYVPYASAWILPRRTENNNPRRDLISFCLVSNRMLYIGQEILYRNIVVTDADTLVLLYRSFLENPELGSHVKAMCLNMNHGGYLANIDNQTVYESDEIDLGPILSRPEGLKHGIGEHLTEAVADNRIAPHMIPITILYTLQFKVIGCTSNLEVLGLNVQPQFTLSDTYQMYNMDDLHLTVVSEILHSTWWKETWPRLRSLKRLHLIGKEDPLWGARSHFVALICRCFLTLSELEQLIWYNHSNGWLDGLSKRVTPGFEDYSLMEAESRYERMRVLELGRGYCFPRDLISLCSTFPNLESLSVDTDSWHSLLKLETAMRPPHFTGDQNPNSGMGTQNLTDSLTRLENLRTLNLDLHYSYNISRSLGPSLFLGLTKFRYLQDVGVPFHSFIREDHDGHHRAVSPARVLPRSLKRLRIVTCFSCLQFRMSNILYDSPWLYQHQAAVLQFLGEIAGLRDAWFPGLSRICYQEGMAKLSPAHCPFSPGPAAAMSFGDFCPFHFHTASDVANLHAVTRALLQSGVAFERKAKLCNCPQY